AKDSSSRLPPKRPSPCRQPVNSIHSTHKDDSLNFFFWSSLRHFPPQQLLPSFLDSQKSRIRCNPKINFSHTLVSQNRKFQPSRENRPADSSNSRILRISSTSRWPPNNSLFTRADDDFSPFFLEEKFNPRDEDVYLTIYRRRRLKKISNSSKFFLPW
ncbi:AAEL005393-PA, partial [Aedes aegypti]